MTLADEGMYKVKSANDPLQRFLRFQKLDLSEENL